MRKLILTAIASMIALGAVLTAPVLAMEQLVASPVFSSDAHNGYTISVDAKKAIAALDRLDKVNDVSKLGVAEKQAINIRKRDILRALAGDKTKLFLLRDVKSGINYGYAFLPSSSSRGLIWVTSRQPIKDSDELRARIMAAILSAGDIKAGQTGMIDRYNNANYLKKRDALIAKFKARMIEFDIADK